MFSKKKKEAKKTIKEALVFIKELKYQEAIDAASRITKTICTRMLASLTRDTNERSVCTL